MINEILTSCAPIFAGIARNLVGWIKSSMEDGQISKYEWSMLIATSLEIALIGYAAMIGLNIDPIQASGIAVVASMGLSAVKK